MVAIINYGMGNLASVKKALDLLKVESKITCDHQEIESSQCIILPGVGSFRQGMENLNQLGLVELLTDQVLVKKKPFLGICLGMQLIFSEGTEPVDCAGLGWLEGKVIKFRDIDLRIPHMGWNSLNVVNDTFMRGHSNEDVYFIHTYHVVPKDLSVVAATTNYGFDVVASVQKENIFATQFHPEKSQVVGLSILEKFLKEHAQI